MHRIKSARIGDVIVDEIDGMTLAQVSLLAEREVVFFTEFVNDGERKMGSIIASSETAAERIAEKRGLGEEVVGILVGAG